jgi:hypothetical protein
MEVSDQFLVPVDERVLSTQWIEMLSQKASLEGRDINITDLVNHITDSAVGLIAIATIY